MRLERATAHALLRRLKGGTLTVVDPSGSETFGDGDGEIDVKVDVADPRAYAAVLRGSLGVAESYADGWWSTDSLGEVLQLGARNIGELRRFHDAGYRYAAPLIGAVQRIHRPDVTPAVRDPQPSRDLPSDLFALFLDDTMTCSCARFDRPGMTLAEAQTAKLDRLCRAIGLRSDHHLVEIGTGWGSLAIHAAENYGCRVTTTTVSEEQRELATRRVREAGLRSRITVLGEDHRRLGGVYDRLVSIETMEAVDWREHDAFLATCSRLLRPDGVMGLQATVAPDQAFERVNATAGFLRTHVFPRGLPSITSISRGATRSTDMRITAVDDQTEHYVETLRQWSTRFVANSDRLADRGVDERSRRMWELRLSYCRAGFAERQLGNVQMVLAKPLWRPEPVRLRRS